MPKKSPGVKRVVHSLTTNPELVVIYIIPSLLIALDLTLRAILHIDLIDIGEDMALFSVSIFSSILVEDLLNSKVKPLVFALFIGFLLPWVVCLYFVSQSNSLVESEKLVYELVYNGLSWLLGGSSLLLSTAFSYHVFLESKNS